MKSVYCHTTGRICSNAACLRRCSGDTGPQPSGGPFLPVAPAVKGCICPPGCEQTCLRHDCGRRDGLNISGPATCSPIFTTTANADSAGMENIRR
jgi:hypothetical protein